MLPGPLGTTKGKQATGRVETAPLGTAPTSKAISSGVARMGTLFVSYGGPEHREEVLAFAAKQAAAAEYDLFVYHVQERTDESVEAVRTEIGEVLADTAPSVDAEIGIETRETPSDETNIATRKLVTDALFESDREFEYAVVGDIERGSIGEAMHASLTQAILNYHAIPVMLVPI